MDARRTRLGPGLSGWLASLLLVVGVGLATPVRSGSEEAGPGDPTSIAVLRWGHDDPGSLRYFKLYSTIDLDDPKDLSWVAIGLPGEGGVYAWPIEVPAHGEIWVSLAAVSLYGLESDRTAWRHYTWDPDQAKLGLPGRAKRVE